MISPKDPAYWEPLQLGGSNLQKLLAAVVADTVGDVLGSLFITLDDAADGSAVVAVYHNETKVAERAFAEMLKEWEDWKRSEKED